MSATDQPTDLRDDRRAEQWVKSILAYLEWRAGLPWVNYTRCRFHPQVEQYILAARCVRDCYYSGPEPYLKRLPETFKKAA